LTGIYRVRLENRVILSYS